MVSDWNLRPRQIGSRDTGLVIRHPSPNGSARSTIGCMPTSRRSFVGSASSLGALALLGRNVAAEENRPARTRLVLLGTAGGPRPRNSRSAPAQAVVVDDAIYVIDCGDGVARQMIRAGLALN